MNYLAELKAFYDKLELNPQPNTVIALWHALMSIANKAGWPDTFTVASSVLGLRSGLNASALKRARNKLATDGFIDWKPRGGNQSAQYHIKSLVVQNRHEFEPQYEPQYEPQCEPQSEPQSEPINKHKLKPKQKPKQNNPPISPAVHFDNVELENAFQEFLTMRKNIKKPISTQQAITRMINRIEKLSGGDDDLAIKIINQSTDHCWQDVYALKDAGSSPKTVFDEWRDA
jgi:hypothetical protein